MRTARLEPAKTAFGQPRDFPPACGALLPQGTRGGYGILLLMLLAIATGCTSWREYVRNGFKVGPNYSPPAAAVADRWLEADGPDVNSREAVQEQWWRVFNDPVLDRLIVDAYRENLSLRVACLRILEARALRGIAAGEWFPQSQEAFGSYTRTGVSSNSPNVLPQRFFDEWTAGPSLAWELDFWGRFRRAVEAADAHLDAQIENYDDVLVLLLSQVAESYVDLRTAEQRLEYARKNAELQGETFNLAKKRFDEGEKDRLPMTQAETNLWQTQSLIPPLEASRRQAANQLCILLGMVPQDIDGVLVNRLADRVIPSAPAQVAVGIPADLLRRRPDIRRAEYEVAAQSAAIGIAVSALYPHFSITGSLFLDAESFKDLLDARSLAGHVGPSFRWDILNYGRLANNIRVQDARFQQLAVGYQDLVLRANAEAENALVAFLKAQQLVKSLRKATTAARQSAELVWTQYHEGSANMTQVYVIQQELTRQQDRLAVAEGAVAKSLIQLYKALGGGWEIRLGPAPQPGAEAGQPSEPVPAPAR
jgi:NodT family efflux transporter outer membrane factor (OMF) lipoprotein